MTLDEEKGKVETADRDATHDLENPLGTTNDNIEVRSDVLQSARQGLATEHEMSPWEAVKAYPMAIFWSLMVSMCVVMEGYDQILIYNFFAFPTFAAKYGQFVDANGNHQLSAAWQAGVGNCSGIGAFFGALANGFLVAKFGQKRILIGSLFVLSAFVFLPFFAPNIAVMAVGQLLCGLPWGVFATSAPAYASEVLPLSLRVYLTSYTNMCFIIGQLIAAGVLAGLVDMKSEWSYRIPFALQWVWPLLLIPILSFCPESPWHLARVGKYEEAEASLRRLQRESAPINPKDTLATIIYTNDLEVELSSGTSFMDCFKGVELRRTEIACMCFAGQVLSGSGFAYNSTYFFQQIGLPTNITYKLNTGGIAMALFGTLISWFAIMPYLGRRAVYLWGMGAMAAILFVIGFLNIRTETSSFALAQAILTLIWTFVFQLSVGQLGWALPAEVGSTRLRQKTIVLARNSYYLVNVVSNVLQPYFMNPTQWNLKGYTGFFWGGTSLIMFVWAFVRLPETKWRSFDELDVLFAKKVPARKFKGYSIDTFDDTNIKELNVEHRE